MWHLGTTTTHRTALPVYDRSTNTSQARSGWSGFVRSSRTTSQHHIAAMLYRAEEGAADVERFDSLIRSIGKMNAP
jgi:hypothetical protein